MTRYEVLERIGAGRMAEIFRGKAIAAGGFEKPVAIKRILPHLSSDPRFVELLAAGEDGRVTPEAVDHLLKTVRAEHGTLSAFANEEHYRFALENGLAAAVDRFSDELIRRGLDENEGKKTKVLSELKISTRLLYAALARMRGKRSKP